MLLVLVLGLTTATGASAGPVVTPGNDASAVLKGATRLKSIVAPGGTSDREIYVGDGDVSPRTEADFYGGAACDLSTPYGNWVASNHVKYEYSQATGVSKVWVNANPQYCPQYTLGDVGALNYLQIDVVQRDTAGATVDFNNVTLNGNALGNFSGAGGWKTWQVKGLDFTAWFVVEGDLVLTWPASPGSSNEINKLQLTVGYVVPPPGVELVTDKTVFCGEPATVDIKFSNVNNLYGYEFKVSYDDSMVDATAVFVNSFFDTLPANIVWNHTCAGGVCKFAVSYVAPQVAVSGSGTVARITFTAHKAGTFNVTVYDDILTDRDGFTLAHTTPAALPLTVECLADVSGKVLLQGRPTPFDPGKVKLTDLGGVFAAVETNFDPVTGAYAFTGVKVQPSGSNYQFDASHALYLGNQMPSHTLNPGAAYVAPDTKLKGGDADNSGLIDVSDLTCIGGKFGGAPPFTCGATGSSDINADGKVNIQDLAIAGGNYGLGTPQAW
jgi:hypothetical protein